VSTVSNALAARAVTFGYDADPVVRDVSLTIQPGDILALAGRNGSGKSTLVRLLSGVLAPRSGVVELDGVNVREVPGSVRARSVAVVPQHLEQHLGFRVRGVVELGRTAYAHLFRPLGDTDRDAVDRAMDATGVTAFAGRQFSDLSGGEQQRVMLAMALAQETRYLLLDEPTVHLDLQHQRDLLELLVQLRRDRQIAVLAVMHDLNLSALYFDRLAVMDRGRLIVDGPPNDVLGDEDVLHTFGDDLIRTRHPQTGAVQIAIRRREMHE
jgi:ABC-type cobalamin/Fe3+-siderophores transport system ATPase subunit